MQAMSPGRPHVLQTALVSTITFAALMLLALVLAWWTWSWLGPSLEPRVQINAEPEAGLSVASTLFGSIARQQPTVATGLAISLLGVIAATGERPGYALIRLDANKTVSVLVGSEVAPGIRLAQVFPDHVILERNGVRETLAWPERGSSALPITPETGK